MKTENEKKEKLSGEDGAVAYTFIKRLCSFSVILGPDEMDFCGLFRA